MVNDSADPKALAALHNAAALFERLWPQAGGAPAVRSVEYLPGGYTNRNYRIETTGGAFALRVVDAPGAPTLDSAAVERRYLEIESAPVVIGRVHRQGHLLTRWIDGPLLVHAPPTPEEAGAYLAALHRDIPTGLRRYDVAATIAADLARAGRVDPQVQARFDALGWWPETMCGCHNDLNPWNVIRETSDGRLRTLDWEVAGDNDPVFDVIGLCFGFGWGQEEMTRCLAVRAASAPDVPVELGAAHLDRTLTVYRLREYAWAVAQIARGNDRKEIRDQAETMRRALARKE